MVFRKWYVGLLPGLLLLTGLALQQPQGVSASSPNSYYWSMTFDFEGSYDGLLYVEYIDVNNVPHRVSTEIPCVPVGRMDIGEETADFQGGYLDCSVPSIQDILNELTGLQLGAVQTYCPFMMEAEIAFIEDQSLYPILAHMASGTQPEARFQVISRHTSRLQAQFANTHLSQGDPFDVKLGEFHSLQTQLMEECYFHHTVDQQMVVDPTWINGADFYIDAAQLYIGYDPETGDILNGRIDSLLIDPGDFIKIN